jgi:hypothetical protein
LEKKITSRYYQALITLTGFDFEMFEWLNETFRSYFEGYSPFVNQNGCTINIEMSKRRSETYYYKHRLPDIEFSMDKDKG